MHFIYILNFYMLLYSDTFDIMYFKNQDENLFIFNRRDKTYS